MENEKIINIKNLAQFIGAKKKSVIITTLVFVLIGVLFVTYGILSNEKQKTVNMSFLITFDMEKAKGSDNLDAVSNIVTSERNTCLDLVTQDIVIDKVIKEISFKKGAETLKESISTDFPKYSNGIFNVSVKGSSKQEVLKIAKSLQNNIVNVINSDENKLVKADVLTGAKLEEKAKLISMTSIKKVVLFAIIGLILSIFVLILRFIFSNRVYSEDDVKRISRNDYIIINKKSHDYSMERIIKSKINTLFDENNNYIDRLIYEIDASRAKNVVVVGNEVEIGKTTVAIQVAKELRKLEKKVLLVNMVCNTEKESCNTLEDAIIVPEGMLRSGRNIVEDIKKLCAKEGYDYTSFDCVIFDTQALVKSINPRYILEKADYVLQIIRKEKSDIIKEQNLISEINKMGIESIGFVYSDY